MGILSLQGSAINYVNGIEITTIEMAVYLDLYSGECHFYFAHKEQNKPHVHCRSPPLSYED
jgi:hypothetical protein